jgi:5S rRNA maturation endonuclease (ribonuclease M5)
MPAKEVKNPVKKIIKKSVGKEIQEKISEALGEYKGAFEEKKFDDKIKKASKLFAGVIKREKAGLKKALVKKKGVVKKVS